MPSITIFLVFYKMQSLQVLTSLKVCLECTPPLSFLGTLRPAAYSKIGFHHRRLHSKACNVTLNGISNMLWTAIITKIFFFAVQAPITNSSSMSVIYSNDLLKTYNIMRTITLINPVIIYWEIRLNNCVNNISHNFWQPIFASSKISTLGKFPPVKLGPGKLSPENSHPENSHPE